MALSDTGCAALAARMLADYDAVRPGQAFADGLRLELPDAWRLQTAVASLREARGERVIGYKVGAVTALNQKMLGVTQPVWGRLWSTELYSGGVELNRVAYANLAKEAEFAILLATDIEPGLSIDQLASCVEAVYPTLELHNLKMQSDYPHGAELVANNCINCGVVCGAPVTDLHTPGETNLKLIHDGKTVDAWQKLRWPQDILAALDWLASALTAQGLRLKSGDRVLTGAWGPPLPVADHQRIDVSSSLFGDVFATVV